MSVKYSDTKWTRSVSLNATDSLGSCRVSIGRDSHHLYLSIGKNGANNTFHPDREEILKFAKGLCDLLDYLPSDDDDDEVQTRES